MSQEERVCTNCGYYYQVYTSDKNKKECPKCGSKKTIIFDVAF